MQASEQARPSCGRRGPLLGCLTRGRPPIGSSCSRVRGNAQELGLGSYPETNVAEAREKADKHRLALKAGKGSPRGATRRPASSRAAQDGICHRPIHCPERATMVAKHNQAVEAGKDLDASAS